MNSRTTSSLAGMLVLASAIAVSSQPGFAQTDVFPTGVFQLNIPKSKFPGAPLKSQTLYIEGQKQAAAGTDGQGNPRAVVFEVIEDGRPHPVTGFPLYDTSTYTRVDAYTVNFTRSKNGKVVQTGTSVVSADGRTLTATWTTTANGAQTTHVYEKQ